MTAYLQFVPAFVLAYEAGLRPSRALKTRRQWAAEDRGSGLGKSRPAALLIS
ncbi:hypothetical protein SH139x_004629 [Planctomycetaceae bacterium SH139]